MSFTQKKIEVVFKLANGQFEGGGNTATISGARVSCAITNTGGASQGEMIMGIYGLPLSMMNQLSTVGTQYLKMYKNQISVYAGDDETGMSLVWNGQILTASVDAQSMPNVCFRVLSQPSPYDAVKPATPLSIRGSADVAGMMQNLAKQMGYGFENAGVTAKLSNPYYAGTAWKQALAIARHAGIDMIVERGVMAIVPSDKARDGDAVLISRETGMIGYPQFTQTNVALTALYNPAVKFLGNIEVKSDLTPANGKWKVIRLAYQLESMVPHGRWEMAIEAAQLGATVS
ncbi:hypothetical protein FP026_29630 [Rhizobium tropici]|uniref:Uncharacterized protein n=1 Tax=Rhizobium tropici TaxID=398 RepID=A0A5B0VKY9_RHITR|nr:hypothetical protein [Rhizobium tropici]KAA1174649.1 hypothetical protein FP026_29630 [Rhizobium tropici]